jgi:hypothetical protein
MNPSTVDSIYSVYVKFVFGKTKVKKKRYLCNGP